MDRLLRLHEEHLSWLLQYLKQQQRIHRVRERELASAAHAAAKKLHSARQRLANARQRALAARRVSAEDGAAPEGEADGERGDFRGANSEAAIPRVSPVVLTQQPTSPLENKSRFEQTAWKDSDPFVAAMGLRATLRFCLEYFDLLESLSKQPPVARGAAVSEAASCVLANAVRALPEPPSSSPMQAVLSPPEFSLLQEQTPLALCEQLSRDVASNSVLFPVAVGWFGSKAPYPHAPLLSLRALHLTFTIRIPDPLLKALSRCWCAGTSRPLWEKRETTRGPTEGTALQELTLATDRDADAAVAATAAAVALPDLIHFHFVGDALADNDAAMAVVAQCLRATQASCLVASSDNFRVGAAGTNGRGLRANVDPTVPADFHRASERDCSEAGAAGGSFAGNSLLLSKRRMREVSGDSWGEGRKPEQSEEGGRLVSACRTTASRLIWVAHDAKQLLHLLANAGLPRPCAHHLHCTAVVAWLLNGGQPRTAEFLQQTALAEYSFPHKTAQGQDTVAGEAAKSGCSVEGSQHTCVAREQQRQSAVLSSAENHCLNAKASSPANPLPDREECESGTPHPVGNQRGQELPWQVNDGKGGSCFVSSYVPLIAESLRLAEAALEVQRAATRSKKSRSTASASPNNSASLVADEGSQRLPASSRFSPWWYSKISAGQLPPEQQHVQQGLFGRFGWGIYSRHREKAPLSSCTPSPAPAAPSEGRTSDAVASPSAKTPSGSSAPQSHEQHLISSSPLAFVPVLPEGVNSEWRLEAPQERVPPGRTAGDGNTNVWQSSANSGDLEAKRWAVRFPTRFKKTVPPSPPETVAAPEAAVFCEARGAAILDLFRRQYSSLQRAHPETETRCVSRRQQKQCLSSDASLDAKDFACEDSDDFEKCLSLPWGVWVTIERPLLPVLVSIERRGLSLNVERLSQAWSIRQGACTHEVLPGSADAPQENAVELPPVASDVEEAERGPAADQEASDAPEHQRRLAEEIRRHIAALTNYSECEININSPR